MRAGAWAVAATLLLAGCGSLRPPAGASSELVGVEAIAAASAAQDARATRLGLGGGQCDAPAWRMTGRVALSNGKDGGSGRIEWTQGERRSEVTLSAPVTRQSWTLAVDATGARLDGVPNGPLDGADATQLLRDATGWEIPVTALGCWLRGVEADQAKFGDARIRFGTHRLPLSIEQGGWTIDYADWKPDAASGDVLPNRVNAQRGDNRVRLIVDRWDAE